MQILLRELIFMLKQLNIPHMQNTKNHLVMPKYDIYHSIKAEITLSKKFRCIQYLLFFIASDISDLIHLITFHLPFYQEDKENLLSLK